MSEIQELLKRASIDKTVGDDFESRVFSKIRRRKVQRRVAVTTSFVFTILGFLFGFLLFLQNSPEKSPALADNRAETEMVTETEKEEIPVLDDVYFSSYDENTSYAVEYVSYTEDERGI